MAITKIEVPELFDFGSDNSAFKLPTGTTADRPQSPSNGEMRFNTTTGYVEYYDTTDTQWWEIDYEALCTTNDPNYPITNLAYYKMSNASDSGEGSGYIGQGGIFNGSSSNVTIAGSSFDYAAMTVSCWFNLSTTSQNYQTIFNNYSQTSGQNRGWYIRYETTGDLRLRGYSSTNVEFDILQSTTINASTWYHLAVTISSSQIKIYQNNNLINTTSISTAIGYSGTGGFPTIGSYRYAIASYGNYFNGKIDQVRIYNTTLSSSNVALLYAETSTTSSTLDYPVTATALYEFSGNANDTGNTYNGTATNVEYAYNGTASNVNFNVAGKFGNAGEFNGSSSYIDLGNNLGLANNSFSFSCWIKNIGTGSNSWVFAAEGSGSTNQKLHIGRDNSNGKFYIDFWGNGLYSTSQVTTNSIWQNWVITFDSTTKSRKIYLNGSLDNSDTSSSNYLGTGDINIGQLPSYNQWLQGTLDQVRIFSSALNASQVTQLYNEIQCVPTIVPTGNFNAVLYTGNSSTQAITGVGFAPDFTWIKRRDGTENHYLQDSVRGSTQQIYTNLTNSQFNETTAVTSFSANGFNMGSYNGINNSGETYVAWNWKAGGAAVSNTDGTITTQVSANVDAGFSIVKFTSPFNGQTAGHGLSSTPEMIILKIVNTSSTWYVWTPALTSGNSLALNDSRAQNTDLAFTVNSTTFTTNWTNTNYEYIAYCFHSVDGYSKIGSYVGTGATGNTIVTGFRPAFVMFKRASAGATTGWFMLDNKRSTGSVWDERLQADTSSAEAGPDSYTITTSSNGFEPTGSFATFSGSNASGATYIFMAFAADPT
jgi:hypothetical protein